MPEHFYFPHHSLLSLHPGVSFSVSYTAYICVFLCVSICVLACVHILCCMWPWCFFYMDKPLSIGDKTIIQYVVHRVMQEAWLPLLNSVCKPLCVVCTGYNNVFGVKGECHFTSWFSVSHWSSPAVKAHSDSARNQYDKIPHSRGWTDEEVAHYTQISFPADWTGWMLMSLPNLQSISFLDCKKMISFTSLVTCSCNNFHYMMNAI